MSGIAVIRTFFILTVVVCNLVAPALAVDDTPPNIVLILADDLGWRDTGFMGSDFYETPNLDRLAAESLVFTDAYANAANCAPSRAALMSGQYAPRTGVYTVGGGDRGKTADRRLLTPPNVRTLDAGVVTIAEVLAARGYATASIGKWHLGQGPQAGPLGQGFDRNVAGNRRGHPKSYFSPYGNDDLPDGEPGEFLTTRLTDEAIAFVDAHRDEPFFLYLPYFAVHTPLQPEPNRLERYRAKSPGALHGHPKYAAMVDALDENIGRLLDTLDAGGLTENTIVVFASDNGGVPAFTSMAPLRGGKGTFYEGGVRVPLAVRWPDRVAAGDCSTPVMLMDFYPTLVEAAGGTLDADRPTDGVSLLPLLTGGPPPDRAALFWHFPAYLEGGRAKGGSIWRTTPCGAVRHGDYKLIEYFEDGRLELYDLVDDVGERHNLAEERPRTTKMLHDELVSWRTAIGAPVPTEPNPEYVAAVNDTRPPNIILFVADDLGYAEVGCYGQTKIRTPNVDRLATEGLRFTQFYSGSPVCAPSRCTLMTGQHTGHAFIRNNRGRPIVGQYPIEADTVTLARLLKERGYATGCVGKWGLGGPDTTGVPWEQGFDLFYGYLDQWRAHNHHPTYLYRNDMQVPLDNPDFAAHQRFETAPDDYTQFRGNDYAPDGMIEEALAFVQEHRDEPFFLFYATTVPHVAVQVPEDSLAEYPADWDDEPYLGQKGYLPHPRPRGAYAGMVTRMDDHFGRLMTRMDELDLAEDTIVLFTSDNGPTYAGGADSEFFESARPLRGLKGSVFEGGVRVPMVVRWPGRVAPGAETDHVAAFWDLMPTLLDIAGAPAVDGIDGVSFSRVLDGRAPLLREMPLYWELGNQQAIRMGDWKLVRRTNKEGVTTTMLFDLATDVGEQKNLADERPEVLARMLELTRASRTTSAVFESVYDDGR